MNTLQKRLLGCGVVGAITACTMHRTPPTPSTGAAATPAARTPATAPATAPAGGSGLARPRPPRISPESLAVLRKNTLRQVLATIAGRENEPAGTVFRNVQVSKAMPAGQFLAMMDSTYGRS